MTYGWEYREDTPFPGYDFVAQEDYDGDPYSWRITDVYHKDGSFYTYDDSGCSCNGPYEDADVTSLSGPKSFAKAIEGFSAAAKEQALKWERP